MPATTTKGRYADWIRPEHESDDPFAAPIYGAKPFVRADLRPTVRDGVETRPGLDGKAPVEVDPPCPHHGPIPKGSVCYCERCAAYGRDYDKRLIRVPGTDPKPEPAVVVEADPEPTRAEKSGRKTSGKMARRNARKRAEMAGAA